MEGYLRKATIADMDLLFEWANDPLVRQNSFTTEKITYEEHQRWFWKALERENFQQYIYMSPLYNFINNIPDAESVVLKP